MLLEKWSTSYLRSTMLKHKPRTAKSKITATNSLQRQPDCTAQKRWMRSASLESLLSCPRLSCPVLPRQRPRAAPAPALTFPPFQATAATPPGWGHRSHRPRPTQAQLTELTAPTSSARMQNKPKPWYLFLVYC